MSEFLQGASPLPAHRGLGGHKLLFLHHREVSEKTAPQRPPPAAVPARPSSPGRALPSPRVSRGPATPATHRRPGRGDRPPTRGPRRVSGCPRAAPPAPRSPPNTRQALAPPPRARGPREVSAPGRPPQRSRGHPRHRPQKGREQSRNPASLRTTTPGMPRPRADYISQKAAGRPPGDALRELSTLCLPPGSPREREAARVTSKAGGLPRSARCLHPPGGLLC